jgi:hypothetical protein
MIHRQRVASTGYDCQKQKQEETTEIRNRREEEKKN